MRITLASASPRRLELLAQIGVSAVVCPSKVDESQISVASVIASGIDPTYAVMTVAARRARAKAEAVAPTPPTRWVLAADTAVEVEQQLLDKPQTVDEARDMLSALSGREHLVHTAVAFADDKRRIAHEITATTKVSFAHLTRADVEWYIATGEWQGVAGAYRIQGSAAAFVTEVHGSYSGVVGLPLHLVYSILARLADETS